MGADRPTMSQLEDELRFELAQFVDSDEAVVFGADDDLFTLLDSLQILRLIMNLEARYGIRIQESEFTVQNLGSVARIVRFLAGKFADGT